MTKNVQLSPLLTTARDILRENKNRPMHVNEISELATKSARNQTMTVEEFSTKLSGALASHLKLKTQTGQDAGSSLSISYSVVTSPA